VLGCENKDDVLAKKTHNNCVNLGKRHETHAHSV